MSARKGYVTLGEIAARIPLLRVECDRCGRRGRYRTVRLAERFGAENSIQPFQEEITANCPRRRDATIELGNGCAPLCPDLSRIFS